MTTQTLPVMSKSWCGCGTVALLSAVGDGAIDGPSEEESRFRWARSCETRADILKC